MKQLLFKRCFAFLLTLCCGLIICSCKNDSILYDELGRIIDTEQDIIIHPLGSYVYLGHMEFENQVAVLPERFGEYTLNAVGEAAFAGNKNLATVIIPDSYRFISMLAFENCDSLKNIVIGNGLQRIEILAFPGCNAVEKVTISKDNPYLYSQDNCIVQRADNKLIQGFSTSIIPDTVVSIGENAFAYVGGVSTFEIPSSIKEIHGAAFSSTQIKEMYLPSSVRLLGDAVFAYCHSFERLYIPSSVTTIGERLFDGSQSNQITVYCEAKEKPEGWSNDWLKGAENVTVVWGYQPE